VKVKLKCRYCKAISGVDSSMVKEGKHIVNGTVVFDKSISCVWCGRTFYLSLSELQEMINGRTQDQK
jgi:hypothetical protein